jgi:hypothetical protein
VSAKIYVFCVNWNVCRCELVTDNTKIEEIQVHFHAQSVREIRIKYFINGDSISN